jgi:hypothetical protein
MIEITLILTCEWMYLEYLPLLITITSSMLAPRIPADSRKIKNACIISHKLIVLM